MSFQNLPPMPKSLSGCLVPSNGIQLLFYPSQHFSHLNFNVTEYHADTNHPTTKPRVLPRTSPREPPPPPPVNEPNLRAARSSSLDIKLGALRKEMVID